MRILAAVAAVALAACGGARTAPMSEGRRTYLAKCTSCHSEYEPSKYTPAEWAATIDKMEHLKKTHLSPQERALILEYLTGDPGGRQTAAAPR